MAARTGSRRVARAMLAVALLLGASGAAAQGAKNPLVGTWRLKSWEMQRSDGKTGFPYGKEPNGLIIWTERGNWLFLVQSSARPPFASPLFQGGTPEEKKAGFETSLSYGGTYTYDEKAKVVSFKVTASTFPNWTGTDQKRLIEFTGSDRYKARSLPVKVGDVEVVAVLDWERIE